MTVTRSSINSVILEEKDVGYLDPGISRVLEVLNSIKGLTTTSSCIGRVVLVEGKVHWGREKDSRILYKTHDQIRPQDILRVIARGFENVWLKATGPIMHVRTRGLDCAIHLLEKARRSGFKHSGIIAYNNNEAVVELLSAPQMASPIVIEGVIVVRTGPQLEYLAGRANMVVESGRQRLFSLSNSISSDPGPCG